MEVTAVVVPCISCDLPLHPVPFDATWNHLVDIPLADPEFGCPCRIDILLGVDVLVDTPLDGWRIGPPDSPIIFETEFAWVLAGRLDSYNSGRHIASHHASFVTGDDLLRKFWKIEESLKSEMALSPEERSVVQYFKDNHHRTETGRFVVPLPKMPHAKPLGESRSQAIRRFLTLERSLYSNSQFDPFNAVKEEYFEMGHAKPVPAADLEKLEQDAFYLPMHVVRKESSSTTEIRAASAKTSYGVSLNDTLLVGPTVHSTPIDVLLRFRFHSVALTMDVSRIYRAVELTSSDRDLHRFVWRCRLDKPLQYYRMTRVTFGVSASSFTANMSVKQNTLDFALDYPQAVDAVENSFNIDDGLTGAESVEEAIELQGQLQDLFSRGGVLLRKWNSSKPTVLQHIPHGLRETQSTHFIP